MTIAIAAPSTVQIDLLPFVLAVAVIATLLALAYEVGLRRGRIEGMMAVVSFFAAIDDAKTQVRENEKPGQDEPKP